MSKLGDWSGVGVVGALVVGLGLLATSAGATPPKPPVCNPRTQQFHHSAQPLATGADQARVVRALGWLRSMLEPPRAPGDGSQISPARAYPHHHTGPINGQFRLARPMAIQGGSPLSVTAPARLADGYRGVVTGTAPVGSSGRVVKAYLLTDAEYEQPAAGVAHVGADGRWRLDLSAVDPGRAGAWRFRLYEGGQQVGDSWPSPGHYQHTEVQLYAVTDAPYLQARQAARADQRFAFGASGPGHKLLRLVDTRHGTVLAEHFRPQLPGLIRSYQYAPGQDGYGTSRTTTSYTYDQALALLVAVGAGDRAMADRLVQGLLTIQAKAGPYAGGFPSSVDQINYTANAHPKYWTGGNAFALYALLRYQERYSGQPGVEAAIRRGLAWVARQRTTTGPAAGLYRGGQGIDDQGQAYAIAWHSTEHNTDLWHALERAGRVLNDGPSRRAADELAQAILAKLWHGPEQRFYQGFGDNDKALDTASWGYSFLSAVGHHDKARASLAQTKAFRVDRGSIKGFTPYADRASSRPTVWFEGTFGVIHAQVLAGQTDQARASLAQVQAAQRPSGAWAYALDADPANGRTDADAVASTAWYLLAVAYPGVMWSECRTGITGSPQVALAQPSMPDHRVDAGSARRTHDLLLAGTGVAMIGLIVTVARAAWRWWRGRTSG